ncbi:hypothetical protein [Micromonospora carbonacea]|uniref:hypothetical protein n=1 Tax=Micromonospora carbonacea TaxID=47853 RepID=UPI0017C42AB5|nr:hypothetical protein [Micromonospora carbonacea]MBB5826249.1 hypothetical protein [Micromonospora carbonacea]
MSIIEDVGAQVRAAAEEFPLAQLALALEKFGQATERLRWVRQESANPMGVPELSAAVEHAESAGHALRVAQEQLSAYLAAIGLAPDGAPPARPAGDRQVHDAPRDAPPAAGDGPPPAPDDNPVLRRWWAVRVAELTGGREGAPDEPDERIGDSRELLRRVADGVRGGDRERLHRELRAAHADVGLGLAALAPPLLRELAGELLGHPPRADDLPRLRRELDGRVRDLLPGLPPPVLETLLTRVCRMPPPPRGSGEEQPHAADAAVTAGVVTAVLLDRLGRDLPRDEGQAGRENGPAQQKRREAERDAWDEATRQRADRERAARERAAQGLPPVPPAPPTGRAAGRGSDG